MAGATSSADFAGFGRTRICDPKWTVANLAPQTDLHREADVHPGEASSFQLLLGASADLPTQDSFVTQQLHVNGWLIGSSTQVAYLCAQAAQDAVVAANKPYIRWSMTAPITPICAGARIRRTAIRSPQRP